MNQAALDDDPVNDYLAESREHLSHIESDLLAMEQAGIEADETLVNRVFRAAHSIKGGAGFFGFRAIRELAHRTENVLDLIRSRQMIPLPEVVSVLLMAFDKLRELLQRTHEDDVAGISEFTAALTRITAEGLPRAEAETVRDRVEIVVPGCAAPLQISAFDWAQARKTGKNVYVIRWDLIHDIQRPGKTPYDALKMLFDYGTVLETVFNLESAGTLEDEAPGELLLDVVYATALDADLVCAALSLPPDRTLLYGRDGVLKGTVEAVEQIEATARNAASAAFPQPDQPPPALNQTPAAPSPAAREGVKAASIPVIAPESTIRLNVTLLDSLMTLAGELVLSRNQLTDAVTRADDRGIRSGTQRISLVTSELQEVVTLTRMQPVGSVFARFPRLVRDLARDLGKEIRVVVEGAEVELDKTLLEGLGDPLTHMVRNAVDHGIETVDERAAGGKERGGVITLRAAQQAGQVVIEISDDGRGLDGEKIAAAAVAKGLVTREQVTGLSERDQAALILLPGLSTAATVSDVSGRGVGMDVVKTNVDKLGGKLEISSVRGRGTKIRIKLPLTLAIIPSLLVSDRGERFAIPQVNVGELIRLRPAQRAQRVGRVGNAEVLTLRDRLVPLLHLSEALGLARDDAANRVWNVVLVDAGSFEYGLVVERLHDTVEIVVKPLGRHLKGLPDYAGATILGDGRVAAILDVAGLAARAGLSAVQAQAASRSDASAAAIESETHSMLLFDNSPGERCAVPIYLVSRIERVSPRQVEYLGGRRTLLYRDATLPVVTLSDVAAVGKVEESQGWVVIVFDHGGRSMGLLVAEPLDMIETSLELDRFTLRQPGIAGSAVLKGRTVLIVDLEEVAAPGVPAGEPPVSEPGDRPTVLLAEDSDFFRGQLQRLIEGVGCDVLAAPDGQAAWELLERNADKVGLVTTDIEMPRMDGLALTRRIRSDKRFDGLPVIAVSTLAGEEEIARGLAAGITEYQVKLNREELSQGIRRALEQRAHGGSSAKTEH